MIARSMRDVSEKVTVLSCHVKLEGGGAKQLCEINGGDTKTVLQKHPCH